MFVKTYSDQVHFKPNQCFRQTMFGGKTKPCGFHEILRDFPQSTKPSHDRWWMNLAMSVQIVKHMLYWTTKECYWEITIILQYNMHRYRVLCDFMYPASEFEHEWTWCNVMQRVNDMNNFSWSWLTLATPIKVRLPHKIWVHKIQPTTVGGRNPATWDIMNLWKWWDKLPTPTGDRRTSSMNSISMLCGQTLPFPTDKLKWNWSTSWSVKKHLIWVPKTTLSKLPKQKLIYQSPKSLLGWFAFQKGTVYV